MTVQADVLDVIEGTVLNGLLIIREATFAVRDADGTDLHVRLIYVPGIRTELTAAVDETLEPRAVSPAVADAVFRAAKTVEQSVAVTLAAWRAAPIPA